MKRTIKCAALLLALALVWPARAAEEAARAAR